MLFKKKISLIISSNPTQHGTNRLSTFALQFTFICLVALSLMACDSEPEQAAISLLVPTEEPRQTIIYTRITATPRPTQTPVPDSQGALQMMDAPGSDTGALRAISNRGETTPEESDTAELVPLRVLERRPSRSSNAPAEPTIRLRLSVEVQADAVRQALRINPELPVEIDVDGKTVMISVTEPLQVGENYYFALDQSTLEDAGFKLRTTYEWHMSRPKPLEKISYHRVGEAPIEFEFNYEIDREHFTNALRITPPVEGELIWNEDGRSAVFQPESRLLPQMEYTISFGQALLATDNTVLGIPAVKRFRTGSAIFRTAPGPDGNGVPTKPIEITFDRPMDPETTAAAFQIEPAMPGEMIVEEDKLIFQPTYYLDEYAEYVVTIEPSALSAEGLQVLQEPYSWQFRTGRLILPVSFGYGPVVQQIDPNGRRIIHFMGTTKEETTARFDLYRLDPPNFVEGYLEFQKGGASHLLQSFFDVAGSPLVSSWNMSVKTDDEWGEGFETTLPSNVESGLYVLNLSSDRLHSQLLLVVSQNRLALKSTEDQAHVWLSNLENGSIENGEIYFYDQNGSLLGSGKTDVNGFFKSDLPVARSLGFVLGWHGAEVTFSAVGSDWIASDVGGFFRYENGRNPENIIYTIVDRPLYRPGDMLQFKAVMRAQDDVDASVPNLLDASSQVEVLLCDRNGQLIEAQTLIPNEFGSIDGSFLLSSRLEPGAYQLRTTFDGVSGWKWFEVKPYQAPELSVSFSTDQESYYLGDTVTVEVVVRDQAGQPLPGADVTLNRYELATNHSMTWVSPYIWDTPINHQSISAQTDQNGRYLFELSVPNLATFEENYRHLLKNPITGQDGVTWGLSLSVKDANGHTESRFKPISIYRSAEGVQLDSITHVQHPGQPFSIGGQLLNSEPVGQLGKRAIEVRLERFISQQETITAESHTVTTDGAGRFAVTFNPDREGYYRVTALLGDAEGGQATDTQRLYLFDRNSSQYREDPAILKIVGTADTYHVGDSASLVVESSVSGPALMTIERDGLLREKMVELTAPITILDLPIERGDAPNLVVGIAIWAEQETVFTGENHVSRPDAELYTAFTGLAVPAVEKMLNIDIKMDPAELQSGMDVPVTIRVTNSKGEPVSAELSLSLVDQTLFAISQDMSRSLHQAFYFARGSSINTYHSYGPTRTLNVVDYFGGCGGGCGGMMMDGDPPRFNAQAGSVWLPTLRTDHNGEVTTMLRLPSGEASWQLSVWAATADTQVGEAEFMLSTMPQEDLSITSEQPETSGG